MALKVLSPPDEHIDLITRALSEFTNTSFSLAEEVTASAAAESLSVSLPHEVFVIDPQFMLDENFLGRAERTGLTYLLQHDQTIFAAAKFLLRKDDEVPQFSSIYGGPFLSNVVDAVRKLERKAEVRAADYHFRAITIPGIYIDAVWLAPIDKDKMDLIVPLFVGTTMLTKYQLYTPKAFFDMLVERKILPVPLNTSPCPPV
jgi:hypothetical protein